MAKKTLPSATVPQPKAKPQAIKPATHAKKPKVYPTTAAARTDVFVSYSHADKKWLERVKVHLKPLERDHGIVVWQDTKLRGGDKWRAEIQKALSKTRVAILLLSADFLASDFIASNELTPLLEAAEKAGTKILSIVVSRCAFHLSPLREFQTMNPPDRPLNTLQEGQSEEVLADVCGRVYELFNPPLAPKKTSTPRRQPTEQPSTAPVKADTGGSKGAALTKKVSPTSRLTSAAQRRSVIPVEAKLVLLVTQRGEWAAVPLQRSSAGSEIDLVCRPTDPDHLAFLGALRQRGDLLGFVIGTRATLCRLRELKAETNGRTESWHLAASPSDIPLPSEMTFNGISPPMQAQARARMLLLSEEATEVSRSFGWSSGGLLSIQPPSPLLRLFQDLQRNVAAFNRIAPLVATWFLRLSGIVEHILDLRIVARGAQAQVTFRGRRAQPYHSAPADEISVNGTLALTNSAVGSEPLRLGPLRR